MTALDIHNYILLLYYSADMCNIYVLCFGVSRQHSSRVRNNPDEVSVREEDLPSICFQRSSEISVTTKYPPSFADGVHATTKENGAAARDTQSIISHSSQMAVDKENEPL